MKFSPDGSQIAFTAGYRVELFDFNSTNGIVSNEKLLELPLGTGTAYGIEFSTNEKYLYSTLPTPATILQWDISSNVDTVINATLQQINSNLTYIHALQMGPNGKIYVSQYGNNYLGVITNPDSSGYSCNYSDSAVFLGTGLCVGGLPNFITSYFLQTGISNIQPPTSNITIYPNPATDKINISFPSGSTQKVTVKIYSITGEVVFAQENKSTVPITNNQLPITQITNGLYFLSVQTDEKLQTKKIVINH